MDTISVIWKQNPPHFKFEITDLRKGHHFHEKFDELFQSVGIFAFWSILTFDKNFSII